MLQLGFCLRAAMCMPACSSYLSPGYYLCAVPGPPTRPPHREALQCPPWARTASGTLSPARSNGVIIMSYYFCFQGDPPEDCIFLFGQENTVFVPGLMFQLWAIKRTCEAQPLRNVDLPSTLHADEFINMQSWPFDQFLGIIRTTGDTRNREADLDSLKSPTSVSHRLKCKNCFSTIKRQFSFTFQI